jgi:hypothetical protein
MSSADSLSGINEAGVWEITLTGGTYTSSARSATFASIESLSGSGYNDTFRFKDGASLNGSVDGRGGTDTLDFSDYTTGIVATLLNGFINVIHAGVTSIENIFGGSGNDNLTGDNGDNVLSGGAGDDEIYGLGGNDTLSSGSGHNILSGGDGDDLIKSEPGSINVLYGGNGYDTAYIYTGSSYTVPLNDIENLTVEPTPEPEHIIPTTGGTTIAAPEKAKARVLVINVITGQLEALIAKGYAAIILRLPEGNQTYFSFINGEIASLAYFDTFELPDDLPVDTSLLFGIEVSLTQNNLPDEQAKEGMIISFVVPQEFNPDDLMIEFWNKKSQTWVEVPSWYEAFLKVTTDDCVFKGLDKNGNKDCLFTKMNHTGSIGRIYAIASTAGKYALVVKGQKVDLSSTTDIASIRLSNGATVQMQSGKGTLVVLPEAVWNVKPALAGDDPISAFTVYTRQQDVISTDFGDQKTTIRFPLKENVPAEQQKIVFWDATSQTWVDVQNVTVVDGSLQAEITQGGTYMQVKR